MLITLRLLYLPESKTNSSINVYFTSTKKPLQCHEITLIEVRSEVDCALQCVNNLYSCVGYVYDRTGHFHFQCNRCFIYDNITSPVTGETSNTTISNMPDINKNTGEIPKIYTFIQVTYKR